VAIQTPQRRESFGKKLLGGAVSSHIETLKRGKQRGARLPYT
jgi:hypothetical protein